MLPTANENEVKDDALTANEDEMKDAALMGTR